MPAMMHACSPSLPASSPMLLAGGTMLAAPGHEAAHMPCHGIVSHIVAVDPDEDEEDLGDEEDLTVAQPAADDESSFDDFDDEFDDDFEEEENDPDWDHPDDGDAEPPPGKPPARKK